MVNNILAIAGIYPQWCRFKQTIGSMIIYARYQGGKFDWLCIQPLYECQKRDTPYIVPLVALNTPLVGTIRL